jgi:hypothetical protein
MQTQTLVSSRAYAPAIDARKNLPKIAATTSGDLHGVTAPGVLESPGELTFGEFLRHPQTLALYGPPTVSDASVLLLEFQQAFPGAATRRDLSRFVRARHSGRPRGFRYWNRLAASIWKTYQGVIRGRERTGRAHVGEVKRLATAQARARREAERSSLRRVPKSDSEKRELAVAQLRKRAQRLKTRADKKLTQAELATQVAAQLLAEASALELELKQLNSAVSESRTTH